MHHSQLAPLPNDLPFRIVSKTIGQGAYAWYVLMLLNLACWVCQIQLMRCPV